jgi:hypothetical protein
LANNHLDAATFQSPERPGDLLGPAMPGHHPQVRGGEREVGVPIDQYHPMLPIQVAPKSVGRSHPTDAPA